MTRRPKHRPSGIPTPSGDGKVVVAYCHPGEVAARFHTSMIDLFVHDMVTKRRIIGGGGHFATRSGANITSARNDLVRSFLDHHDAEWLFMVDADMGFDRDIVDRLVEAADPVERPILGALCFGVWEGAGQHELFPTIYFWTENPRGVARAVEYPDNTIVQCGATGAACTLIHRTVLEKMRAEFPDPWNWYAEQIFDGKPMSEDITFCLRAGSLGFPVHVHTGVKTSHMKLHPLDEHAFAAYKARQQQPGFVITGTGRSGTQYIAHVLRQVGIQCGHEDWWNPFNKHTPDLDGDASWMAVPFLHTYQGHVFHQVRDPLMVLNSLRNGELFGADAVWFADFTNTHTPGGFTDDLESALRFMSHWLRTVEPRAELAWRVEDVNADLIVDLCRRIGRPTTLQQAQAAVDAIPTNLNSHNPKPGIHWADLPDNPDTAFLRSWAIRWGYPTN